MRPGLHADQRLPALARLAMRTRFEIVLADRDDPLRLRAAGEEALDEIERVESRLSAFRDDADLFRINALAAQQPVPVDAPMLAFLHAAQALCAQTDGAFDPAIGALLACWRQAAHANVDDPRPPSAERITAALAASGMRQHVILDATTSSVRFSHGGVQLDAGAIGKGHALDRACGLLRDSGIANALLHGGTSTVCAIGRPQGQPAWTIAVRDPLDPDGQVATAALIDTSLSVSAVHGRAFSAGGRRYGHVIDPRSGWPVQEHLLAAVIHPSAMTSDALSTALLVLGPDGLRLLAERFPEAALLLVHRTPAGPRTDVVGNGFTIVAAVRSTDAARAQPAAVAATGAGPS